MDIAVFQTLDLRTIAMGLGKWKGRIFAAPKSMRLVWYFNMLPSGRFILHCSLCILVSTSTTSTDFFLISQIGSHLKALQR